MLKSILILTVSVLSFSSASFAMDKSAPDINPVSSLTSHTIVIPISREEGPSVPSMVVQPAASEGIKFSLNKQSVKSFFSKLFACCNVPVEDLEDLSQFAEGIVNTATTVQHFVKDHAGEINQLTQQVSSVVKNVESLTKR